jgi:hypothetical protein
VVGTGQYFAEREFGVPYPEEVLRRQIGFGEADEISQGR